MLLQVCETHSIEEIACHHLEGQMFKNFHASEKKDIM